MGRDDSSVLERLPAAQRIALLLQEKIERREFQPGEWLPTERELAREFRADRTTVRAAINQLAEKRLVIRQSGRRPWINAPSGDGPTPDRQPASSSALQTIAAVIPQPANYPALSTIQRGILSALRQVNSPYRMIAFDNQGEVWERSIALERQALEAIENEGIAGAVLWHIGGEATLPEIQRLREKGIPLVLLDRRPEVLNCDFVGVDNRTAARQAVRHLIRLGHRRIAHLTSDQDISTVREREEAYTATLRAHAIEPSEDLIFRLQEHDDLYPDLRPVVERFASLPEPPTAVFALKDILAHAFIAEAKAHGLRVPEDISVIGFDDHERYSLQPPMLTTLHQPFEEMGQRAAELLLQRLASPQSLHAPCQHVMLPAPLVVRSTCRELSGR